MRVHEREQKVSIAQIDLDLKLHRYQWPKYGVEGSDKDLDDVEMLRLVTLEIRQILLDMEPEIRTQTRHSDLKGVIRNHQKETELTDVELLQGLFSYCSSKMKYMLRYERHGNYDKPAGLD